MRSLLASLAFVLAWSVPSAVFALDKLITVTGEGSIAAAPDQAIIRIGVSTQAKTAREASDTNANQMSAVIATIKDAGVAGRDVETTRLSLQPQFDQDKKGGNRLIGFRANNEVNVKVREISRLPTLLDRAIAGGANEVSGIDFIVSDYSKRLDDARAAAVVDARRKAEIYAKAAGLTVGRAIAISEEGAPPPRPAAMLRQAGAAPIAPGEQTLHVSVTVSYDLMQ